MIQKQIRGNLLMENFWTSKKPINGLRHFVLVNEYKEKDKRQFLFVSVIDAEINFKVSYEDLLNKSYWEKGWSDLTKIESITKDYLSYKQIRKNKKCFDKIFVNHDSLFYIS